MSNQHATAPKQDNDLGLGSSITGDYRIMDKLGRFRAKRKGRFYWHPYQALLEMSWLRFHLVIILFYALANAIFATMYFNIGAEALSGEPANTFFLAYLKAYFFSVQTLTTVGYGAVAPVGILSNTIAAAEALFGLLTFALITGLYYAKFTRPEAKILYSAQALIAPFKDNTNALMFRVVNQRNSQLIDVEVQMTLSWVEMEDGLKRRRFQGLDLERNKISLFPLNWTLVHPITPNSPLFGKNADDMKSINAEILVFLKAHDATFSQMVQSNSSYQHQDFLWSHKFLPMYFADAKEGSVLDLAKINDTQPAELFSGNKEA